MSIKTIIHRGKYLKFCMLNLKFLPEKYFEIKDACLVLLVLKIDVLKLYLLPTKIL
jgi:hypothetical protein